MTCLGTSQFVGSWSLGASIFEDFVECQSGLIDDERMHPKYALISSSYYLSLDIDRFLKRLYLDQMKSTRLRDN